MIIQLYQCVTINRFYRCADVVVKIGVTLRLRMSGVYLHVSREEILEVDGQNLLYHLSVVRLMGSYRSV